MIVKTTIHINSTIKGKLIRAAVKTPFTESEIITKVMKSMMNKMKPLSKYSRPVEYQKLPEGAMWERVHVRWLLRDYDYFNDMRKLCRKSVSYLVSLAISEYIDELLKDENIDNYQFTSYILITREKDDIISWEVYWDFPQTLNLPTYKIFDD